MSTSGESAPASPPTLEQAVRRLEEIGGILERGDLELDESLALYEEGVRLVRSCEAFLAAAEFRIEQLRGEEGAFRFDPLSGRS